ncbi:MAG TPA: type II toxin-antitoxin system VapC family toxin [Methylomirabilota bacterium]|nr:type II toxin-antitoxin system VapC family toxin [Methylomirabilota bacterium]
MKLLLDTHIFLWAFLEPERLTETVAEALEASSSELWLSPISTWECLLLARKGRAVLEPDPVVWVRKRLEELRPIEAPVNHEVALESERIDLAHQDPADRFLAATAVVFDLTLVTADDRLLKSKSFAVMPNK